MKQSLLPAETSKMDAHHADTLRRNQPRSWALRVAIPAWRIVGVNVISEPETETVSRDEMEDLFGDVLNRVGKGPKLTPSELREVRRTARVRAALLS